VAARAQAHRPVVDRGKAVLLRAQHRSRRVIHRAEKHAGKRERHIMFRLGFHAPLTPFEASHPFRVDEVRPGARHGGGLLVTVKVNEHFALGRFAADFMIVVDQQLVTSLHEVDLNSFDAPFVILFELWLKLIVERLPVPYYNDADVSKIVMGSQYIMAYFGYV